METPTYGPNAWTFTYPPSVEGQYLQPLHTDKYRLYRDVRTKDGSRVARYLCFDCENWNKKEFLELQEELEPQFQKRLTQAKLKWATWLRNSPIFDESALNPAGFFEHPPLPTFKDMTEAKSNRRDKFVVVMDLGAAAEAAALESLSLEFRDYQDFPPYNTLGLRDYQGEKLPETYKEVLLARHKPEARVNPTTGFWDTYDDFRMVWRGSIYRDKDEQIVFFWSYDQILSKPSD